MKNFGIIICLISLLSCQEEVQLDLGDIPKKPIIEAIWTDNASDNFIRITYTRDYYDTLDNEVAKNASVSIKDNSSGETVDFNYVEELGYYLPINNQVAITGHQYTMKVLLDDVAYTSEGITKEPPVLDSITSRFREERFFAEEGYYLTLYGKIPFEDGNFYRLLVTKNDTLLNGTDDYFLFDDTFGTNILDNGFELNGFAFEENDKVKLQLIRLNENAYDYLVQFVSLLSNDGGLFSPPPENPISNIIASKGEGQVLGYFMTGSIISKTITIEESEQ
ncbi:DUF4249 family protein [Cyclobacterium amurskyense]|uniref:DUF4249 domain-containing protein n=1 Tax=Cyclobacterium amurskyense TaxID=320787 RepID=A0A0H4PUM8_9BACT|nr:DUF4249 family protein [Cyclobacterium amurskyense]AKP52032.1 hypothetical protein CA2015_2621 [Cyclobacterium amurskyense]|tara:strand:- start:1170 stop:2003 length:834 start_codon:yes stop_codon:yes gene_type:complete